MVEENPVPGDWILAIERLLQVIDTLRSPGGCPWDQKQSVKSLAPHVVEECHEMADAVARGDMADTCEELGDILLGVFMISRVASEGDVFNPGDVARGITEKLIRRHPHVYGDVQVDDNEQKVLKNWEAIKKKEKEEKGGDASALSGVPETLPALLRAYRVGQKASNAGFDWPDSRGPKEKIDEEWIELKEALASEDKEAVEEELGDLLFAVVNLARKVKIEPELALRGTVEKFSSRFRYVEAHLGKSLEAATLEEMNVLWDRAKETEL